MEPKNYPASARTQVRSETRMAICYRVEFSDGAAEFVVQPGGSFTIFGGGVLHVMDALDMGIKGAVGNTSEITPGSAE